MGLKCQIFITEKGKTHYYPVSGFFDLRRGQHEDKVFARADAIPTSSDGDLAYLNQTAAASATPIGAICTCAALAISFIPR